MSLGDQVSLGNIPRTSKLSLTSVEKLRSLYLLCSIVVGEEKEERGGGGGGGEGGREGGRE